ncbi:MAG: EAL domain-containing protein [Thalassotalea sp.]
MKKRSTQEYLLLSISAFAALAVFPFVFYRVFHQEYLTALIDGVIVIALISIFCFIFFTRKLNRASHLLAAIALIGIITVVYLNGANYVYWLFPSVVAAFYLFSIQRALITSVLFSLTIFILVYQKVDIDVFFTLVVTLLITCIFAFVFAKEMKSQHEKLLANSQITKLRNNTLEIMVSSKSIYEILNAIALNVESEYSNIKCSISLIDNTGKHLVFGAAPSLPDFYNQAVNDIAIGEGVGSCGTAAYLAERVIVADINNHPYWQQYLPLAQQVNLQACWSEPIKNADGKVLGTFALYHHEILMPSERDLALIEQFAHLASIAIEREKANQLIWQQANFDGLTELPNRNMMVEHLKKSMSRADRDKGKLGIAFLDLDHFKDINDTLGHAVGDLLLIEVAKRISLNVRKNDIVARLGGDEFVIIYADFTHAASPSKVAETLLCELSTPYQLKTNTVHTSASIGITVYPDDGDDIDELLKNADQAMYCAKRAGRNSCYFFTETMRETAFTRNELINDLRIAIQENQFFVAYQPIIELSTNKIEKAEALIRWQHPTKGLISPYDFIPIAEETGLIIDISDLLFQTVLIDVVQWRNLVPNFQVSVNTSPLQYKKSSGNILAWLNALSAKSIPADSIILEITENLLMESHADIEDVLNRVREANISIAIDDFGTGYCSFAYLKEYKTDYLKIDKSFVHNMEAGNHDLALCEAIIVMANKLGIKVVAEGIETQEQKVLLSKLFCEYGQGYYFSMPIKAQEFTEQFLQ